MLAIGEKTPLRFFVQIGKNIFFLQKSFYIWCLWTSTFFGCGVLKRGREDPKYYDFSTHKKTRRKLFHKSFQTLVYIFFYKRDLDCIRGNLDSIKIPQKKTQIGKSKLICFINHFHILDIMHINFIFTVSVYIVSPNWISINFLEIS